MASDYTYDSLARLDLLTHKNDAGTPVTLASYTWTFDSLNRIESFDSSYYWNSTTYNESVDYTYDANHQLIAADHTGSSDDEQYVYDLNGNRQLATNTLGTNSEYTTGDNNYLLSDGTYEYEYDKEGNRTKRTEIATDDYVEYTWDHRNRLVTVTEKDDTDTTLKVVDQIYDTYNRWIGRNVDTTSPFDMADAAETHFIYDGNQIILEFDDTQPNDLRHRYLWGPAVDQILSDEQYDPADPSHDDPATEEGIVLWPLTDHLNTVRDIAQHDATSGTALLVNHLEYNSFGLVTSETDTSVDLLFLYTARPFDESTNLQNNLNRWYDILVGAWISEDPIGFEAGDANLGRYVANSPVSISDPSGLDIWIENSSGAEPAGHQSLAIGDPNGRYRSFSFGATGFDGRGLVGQIYEDVELGGTIKSGTYLWTPQFVDADVIKFFEELLGSSASYRLLDKNCRTFSQDAHKALKNYLTPGGFAEQVGSPKRTKKFTSAAPGGFVSTRNTSRPTGSTSSTTDATSGTTNATSPSARQSNRHPKRKKLPSLPFYGDSLKDLCYPTLTKDEKRRKELREK